MLTHEETLELITLAQQGDDGAKEKLINENIPLIKSIVKRFKGRLEYDDLMQLGSMGFIKAMMGFDASFGVRFSTYAVPMISGEIKRFLRDDGAVKVSRWAKTLASKISRLIDEDLKLGKEEPSIDQIAARLNADPEDIVFAMDASHYLLSLSETSGDDDQTPLGDRIQGEPSPDENLDGIILREIITELPDREKKIIVLRYFRDKTQSEVARELGVSQVQVSRIEAKILKKLKEQISDI